MSSQKINGAAGFNEGGATVFATVTGEATDVTNPDFTRTAVPQDYNMYGIVESQDILETAATQELRAGIPGRQFEVLSYAFVCSDASTVTFESNTTVIGSPFAVAANGGVSANGGGEALFTTAVGEALNVQTTVGDIGGHITYRII